jgi:hypothetical protein
MIPTLRDLAEDAFAYMEGPTKPILERLGFETICEMRAFVDSTA